MIRGVGAPPALARPDTPNVRGPNAPAGRPFAELLGNALNQTGEIKFSAHALQRLQERGIELTAQDKSRLADAVQKAANKGARESLVLMDRVALVVSVANKTVITAVPEDELGDAVFTNIDSAVLVKDAAPPQS
jgi:flagellar operon protein